MNKKWIAAPYMVWMVLFIVAPLVIVVFYTFTDAAGQFTLGNLVNLGEYAFTFLDSIGLGAAAAVVCLLLGYPVAYAISCASPRAQEIA